MYSVFPKHNYITYILKWVLKISSQPTHFFIIFNFMMHEKNVPDCPVCEDFLLYWRVLTCAKLKKSFSLGVEGNLKFMCKISYEFKIDNLH